MMHIKTDHFESSLGQTQTPYIWSFCHSVITSVFQETEAKCVAALVKGEKNPGARTNPNGFLGPPAYNLSGRAVGHPLFLGFTPT